MKKKIELLEAWKIKDFDFPSDLTKKHIEKIYEDTADWIPATVPNVVQEILFECGKLSKDVLETGVADDCKWVSEKDWAYCRTFPKPQGEGRVFLECLGLDAVVDIYLNKELMARHRSMYLTNRIDITSHLQEENELLLFFHRPKKIMKDLEAFLPERYEGKLTAGSLLRKTHGDFGSHGGVVPYFTPIGVYDNIQLVVVDRCEILHTDIDIRFLEDLSVANMMIRVECSGDMEKVLPIFSLTDPSGTMAVQVEGEAGSWHAKGDIFEYSICIPVENPALWWPKNYGEQPLYKLETKLLQNQDVLDSSKKTIGFRQIDVVGDMKFRVNGVVVKLWGTCIVPMWGVSHRWQKDRGYKLLEYADKANMNTIRLWGPGQPYHDEFYEETDRLGILIWQEFHTWGTHMPDIPMYTNSVVAEATNMIRRLKNHPCIFMWCGGNEQPYMCDLFDSEAKIRLGHDIIRYTLKDLTAKLDPYRYYHVSAPSMGEYANEAAYGDNHGSRASLAFLPGEAHSHFFSEDIRTTIPELKSLKRFIPPEGLWPKGYEDRQPFGVTKPLPPAWMDRTINHMEEKAGPYELFYDATDPSSLIYKMNAAATQDNRLVIHQLRQGKPFYNSMAERACNGYLIWKLETAWPQIYCALIDYYMEPGQTYYGVRRAYAPLHISIDLQDHVYIWGTNDTRLDFDGTATIEIYNLEEEKMVISRTFPVGISAGDSTLFRNLDALGQFPRMCVIHAILRDADGQWIDEDFQYIKPERKLPFPDAKLTVRKIDERTMEITADRFSRCVELSGDHDGDAFGWHFEDNYFDLMPNQSKLVRIFGKYESGKISAKAFYSPHSTTVEW